MKQGIDPATHKPFLNNESLLKKKGKIINDNASISISKGFSYTHNVRILTGIFISTFNERFDQSL